MANACDVLVVEDDPGLRTAVATILADEGWSVVSAHHGHEALHLLETLRPGVMLVDFFMPGMTGRELIQAVMTSKRLRTIPIVGTSAAERPGAIPGMSSFLAKPFSLEDLLRAIGLYVAPRRAEKAPRSRRSAPWRPRRLKGRKGAKAQEPSV
jgi:CheY-like chemotaxis protein